MYNKLYSSTDSDLVSDWTDRWLKLITLINNVTGTDEAPWSPPPPTDLDEIQYQGHRFWFLSHQAQFVPLWNDFYQCQEWASYQDYNEEDTSDLEDLDEYRENPFLFFYKPENLFRLAQQLALQNGIDIWEPSEYRAVTIRTLMVRMGKIMIEFVDWIEERLSTDE